MPRHRVPPSSPMTGSSGASSTPRPLDFTNACSGILDRPLSRTMTAVGVARSHLINRDRFNFQTAALFRRHTFAFSRRDTPGLLCEPPSKNRGRRESRVPAAPAASRAKLSEAHERSHHRFTEFNRLSPRNGFNGFLRALPGDEFVLS